MDYIKDGIIIEQKTETEAEKQEERLKRFAEYNNKYKKEHYDHIVILAPKGMRDEIKAKAQEEKMTLTQYILAAVKEKMLR